MAKEFTLRGKTVHDIKTMSLTEFAKLIPSRERRRLLKKSFTDAEKQFLAHLTKNKRDYKTHCRDLPIIPSMLEKTIKVHSGKEFVPILITPEMLGHRLGEFVMTRKKVQHNAPGIGATKSSASLSVR